MGFWAQLAQLTEKKYFLMKKEIRKNNITKKEMCLLLEKLSYKFVLYVLFLLHYVPLIIV
jgi:hypothetical protein